MITSATRLQYCGAAVESPILRSLRMLPSPYHQYYYQHEDALAKDIEAYNNKGTRAETVMEVERQLFERYKDAKIHEKPKELESRGGAYYSESACSLMNSLYHHSMDIQTVNTLNKGSIPDLPDDAVIEVNSVITKADRFPDRRKTARCHQRADHLDEKI